MATITLYASKVNQMSSLINNAKKAVKEYRSDLKSLKSKVLKIDSGICNVDDVISSIKSSTQTQEDKIDALDNLKKDVNEFISDVVRIDGDAADAINQSKNDFYDKYEYLKPDCEKSWLEEKLDNACEWCKECWKELLIGLSTLIAFIAVVAVIVSTWPYSGLVLLLFGITISCTRSVYNGSLPPPYTYDETFPQSMSDCLGINYSDYIKTMHYQYGFDEQIAILYLKLYLQVANDPSMRGKSEREIACEFNRIIASLCINYDGDAKRWRLTTGNYKSVDAYEMLINKYGFTEADAIDFAIALNVQHGSNYENIELHFGFSREEGNLFNGENPPTVEEFKRRANELGSEVMKDFVHEALQYVEFNDNLDIVDFANGSTDRMISYSGDIISTRYDDQDFLSDIDPNNIQYKFENSNSNFLKVQQEYNKAVMDGRIDPKSEFISNNGGIDQIRNNINYDVKSTLGAYIDGEFVGEKKKRADKYKQHIDAFITFLQD